MNNIEIDGIARQIRDNEIDVWCASPKEISEPDYEKWIQSEKEWILAFNIPIKNLFIFDQGNTFPGKLCFTEEDNNHILFAMPAIKTSSNSKSIALKLFQLAINEAEKRNVTRLETFLDDCNKPYFVLKNTLIELGFHVIKHKVLYSRDLRKPIINKIKKNITYKNVDSLGFEAVKQLFVTCLNKSLENHDNSCSPSPENEFKEIWDHIQKNREYSKIAFYKEQPVGLLLFDFIDEKTGSFAYFAISPEFRNQGFGDYLFIEGLKILQTLNITKYLDSTNILNYPMIKILERNGCKKIMARMEFLYQRKRK